jgi:hypothetical protein
MKRMKLALQDEAAVLIAHPWKVTVISEIRTCRSSAALKPCSRVLRHGE